MSAASGIGEVAQLRFSACALRAMLVPTASKKQALGFAIRTQASCGCALDLQQLTTARKSPVPPASGPACGSRATLPFARADVPGVVPTFLRPSRGRTLRHGTRGSGLSRPVHAASVNHKRVRNGRIDEC